jgi:hypothetical protein
MTSAAAIIATSALGKVVLYSLASGVGIAVIFGLGVSSAAGLLESLRERRTAASAAWGVVTLVCVAGTLAAVVLGIVVMSEK